MKHITLSLITFCSILSADSFLGDNVTADLRAMYFERTFDNTTPDAQSTTVGGIVSYKSNEYKGISFGTSYFGSYKVGNWFTREEGIGTSTLGRSGEDLSFIGEAYLQYKNEFLTTKIGRQRLSTPLMNDHDLRMLPSSYEAFVVQSKIIPSTTVEAGLVTSYTGFGSKENEFKDYNTKWGKHGLGYIYVTTNPVSNLSLKSQYIQAISSTDTANNLIPVDSYWYADTSYKLPFVTFAAQTGGNEYNTGKNSFMYGYKASTTIKDIDVVLLYNRIKDNCFQAVEAGPMYTDWQQGYGMYEASTAYGVQLISKPVTNLSVKLAAVNVSANEGNTIDDYTEYNLDTQYSINKSNKLRLRYSVKDQTSDSTREDRTDLRMFYYLSF